jgi:hypothetical protein
MFDRLCPQAAVRESASPATAPQEVALRARSARFDHADNCYTNPLQYPRHPGMRRDRCFRPPPSTRRRIEASIRGGSALWGQLPGKSTGRTRGLAFLLGISRYGIARVAQT